MKKSIYDRPVKTKREVSKSAFNFLFSEIVQYSQSRSNRDAQILTNQLEELGYPLGLKFLELTCLREKSSTKEHTIINMLRFIRDPFWRTLFNKPAGDIEQSTVDDCMFMIYEEEPALCNQFSSAPRGQERINCSAFVAGIIEGLLNASGFAARVTAHFSNDSTVFLVKFAPETIKNRNV